MFGTKVKGLAEPCYVILLLLLGLGGGYVFGRPQGDVRKQSAPSGPSLRFSPELLVENTLESAASPASIYPHFPPSAVARNNPPPPANDNGKGQTKAGRGANTNKKGNSLDNTHDPTSFVSSSQDRPIDPEGVSSQRGFDVNNVNTVNNNNNNNNNNGQSWPSGVVGVSSNTGVNANGVQPEQQYDGLHDSYRTGVIPSGERPPPTPVQDPGVPSKIAVRLSKDNTDTNRLQSSGYSPSREPTMVKGDVGLQEAHQQNAPYRSVYPAVSNGSPQIHEDVDVDGLHGAGPPPSSSEEDLGLSPLLRDPPPPPRPFQPRSYQAGDVPASSSIHTISGQQALSGDIDLDRPLDQNPALKPIPGNQEHLFPPSFDEKDLDDETFAIEVELDLDSDENPFRDEEDGGGEVPLELALQVIQAMKAEPAWKQYIGSGWEEMEPYWEDEDEYDEDEDGYYYDDEESDEYDDWIPAGNLSPQNSRLITLIIETIGVTDKEDSQDSDMDIWQIFNNFPFHMLLGKQNVDEDDYYYSDEYDEDDYDEDEYDEDDYDEDDYDEDDYDTEDEYDEYDYDEDSYDDDDYDDIYDDDDEENQKFAVSREEDRANFLRLRKEIDSDSDEVFDDGDDCDDDELCRNDVNNGVKKDDFTIFSVVPPMITKK